MSSLDESLPRRGSSKRRPPTCSRLSAVRLSIFKRCWIRSLKRQLACVTPNWEFYSVVRETFTRAQLITDIRLNFERFMKAVQSRQGVERPLDEQRSKAKRFILPTFLPIPIHIPRRAKARPIPGQSWRAFVARRQADWGIVLGTRRAAAIHREAD